LPSVQSIRCSIWTVPFSPRACSSGCAVVVVDGDGELLLGGSWPITIDRGILQLQRFRKFMGDIRVDRDIIPRRIAYGDALVAM